MSLNDWILSLHLLSAFSMVGAITLFSITIVAMRTADTPGKVLALAALTKIGNFAVYLGVAGTIIFGVWLAISLDAHEVWDGWIIASLVLWAVAVESGRRAEAEYELAGRRAAELTEAGRAGRRARNADPHPQRARVPHDHHGRRPGHPRPHDPEARCLSSSPQCGRTTGTSRCSCTCWAR